MNHRISNLFTLAVIGLVALQPGFASAGDNQPPQGFSPLFNGENLNGWHGMGHFNPYKLKTMSDGDRAAKKEKDMESVRQHWSVENGEIVNDGHGVFLTTDQEFGDVEFMVDYKTVADADSGIYLRATPQVQIWDFTEEGGKWNIGADKGSGGLWNNAAGSPGKDPLVLADNPFGQWNSFRILMVGERTTVYLNDKLVVDNARLHNFWDRESPLHSHGPIQLQTHGGEIRWKNVYARNISHQEANLILSAADESGFTTIFNGRDFRNWAGPTDNYMINNGTIQCKPGKGGTIYTKKSYDDFIVRFEFKLPPGGNNGLAIRYPGSGDTAYHGMCELQILDNTAEKYAKLDPRQYHGSAYGIAPAHRGFLRPVGSWNYQQVTVNGSQITVELNGTTILDADVSKVDSFMAERPHPGLSRKSGHFGFAGHGDPVQFKNIRIKKI